MPIPSGDKLSFGDLEYNGTAYSDILRQLAPGVFHSGDGCHLDPDIRENIRRDAVPGWRPAFGQIGTAQRYLHNCGVGPGDLFLFFGRFQKTMGDPAAGTLRFDTSRPVVHIIYGYMETGEILTNDGIAGCEWHPHGCGERLEDDSNALYLPSDTLSDGSGRRGCGVFGHSEHLVLTLADKTATWKEIPALMPDNIAANRKNSADREGLYYKGIWQELVLKENSLSKEWAEHILTHGVRRA
jgi:hypothetical protein